MKSVHRYSLSLIAPLLLISLSSRIHAVEFNQVIIDQSTLSFGYKQIGVPLEGNFRKFMARMAFDPARPHAAHAQLEIDLASIDTGVSEADAEVLGTQWFNTKAFPTAQFVSTQVKPLGGNRFEVQGKLTIKGQTREISAPFTFKSEGASGVFDGVYTLKRLDYAIGVGPWADLDTVANDVHIRFHIVASPAPAKK